MFGQSEPELEMKEYPSPLHVAICTVPVLIGLIIVGLAGCAILALFIPVSPFLAFAWWRRHQAREAIATAHGPN